MRVDLEIDAGRLLFGLSRIGYTTSSALCDIVDNSIRANAKNINISIIKERPDLADSKTNNVQCYVISDDGDGMSESDIQNALKLGSSKDNYDENSLSKFGLGLKSAAFSQGDKLRVISSNGEADFIQYTIELSEILTTGDYYAHKIPLSENDRVLLKQNNLTKKGTVIIIDSIRKNNHPSVKNTLKELNTKIGVIYYYFISENNVKVSLKDKPILPIDPLFVDEASEYPNLDENVWQGKNVAWIEKRKELVLDDEKDIRVGIEITQLPYPPIFKILNPGENKDIEVRDKYLIGAGNYGFYVYRNRRLISWASQLQGILPQDQDYYAFRGRIFIEDEADDFFNIDVKKSTITLSDEAWNVISDFTKEAKAKSKKAWRNAGNVVKDIVNKNPEEVVNKIVADFETPDLLPGDQLLDNDINIERVELIKSDMSKKVQQLVEMVNDETGQQLKAEDLTIEEKHEVISGKKRYEDNRIFRVSNVLDNLLWEPYYDTELGNCVRINKFHRYARLIYEDNSKNQELQILFDLLLLQLAESELYALKNIPKYEYKDINKILIEFRRIISEFLANMVRKLEDELPPNLTNND